MSLFPWCSLKSFFYWNQWNPWIRRVLRLPVFVFALWIAGGLSSCSKKTETPSFSVPPRPGHLLYDETQNLHPQVKHSLETLLTEHHRITHQEVILSIFTELDKHLLPGITRTLYEKWQMGTPNQSNGILLTLSLNNALAHLEVGYGLETVLTPSQSQKILKESVLPFLKNRQLNESSLLGAFQILEALESPLLENGKAAEILKNTPLPDSLDPDTEDASWTTIALLLILGALLFSWVCMEALSREAHFSGKGWYRIPPGRSLQLAAILIIKAFKKKNTPSTPQGSTSLQDRLGGIRGHW